ncbi:tetratricopeptide repeat protein [Aquamicrobium segne]|uniref:Tetratricopeptide repeat protein n=1 Tax=Aquamicrobium segne TaxID=469547 RepID=A0ABW0GX80_9HYPH
MADDSFIREVNEEIRKEQAQAIWKRYGPAIITIAILVVLATSAFVAYRHWDESRANRSGDAFSQALMLANEGKEQEALAALTELEKDGYGAYPVLARLRAATFKADSGDSAAAVSELDLVAADSAIPQVLRDMARLRAGLLLVDSGSYSDVSARVETLASDSDALRHSAREALGLSAWKEGKTADALKLFEQIAEDDQAPQNIRQRATLMSELIRGSGNAS